MPTRPWLLLWLSWVALLVEDDRFSTCTGAAVMAMMIRVRSTPTAGRLTELEALERRFKDRQADGGAGGSRRGRRGSARRAGSKHLQGTDDGHHRGHQGGGAQQGQRQHAPCSRQPAAPSIGCRFCQVSTEMEARPPTNDRKQNPGSPATRTPGSRRRRTCPAGEPGHRGDAHAGTGTQLTTPNCSLKRYRMKTDTEAADRISGKKKAERTGTRSQASVYLHCMMARASGEPQLEGHGHHDEHDGVQERHPDGGVLDHFGEVVEAHGYGRCAETMSQRKNARTTRAPQSGSG